MAAHRPDAGVGSCAETVGTGVVADGVWLGVAVVTGAVVWLGDGLAD